MESMIFKFLCIHNFSLESFCRFWSILNKTRVSKRSRPPTRGEIAVVSIGDHTCTSMNIFYHCSMDEFLSGVSVKHYIYQALASVGAWLAEGRMAPGLPISC